MKKLFTEKTLFIKDGKMLEDVKDRFFKQGYTTLWGYNQHDYKDDKEVSSGFLHYEDKVYFLAKSDYRKPVMSVEEFATTIVADKKPKSKTKKRYSENDLREAMEYGLDFGYQKGFTDASLDEPTYHEGFNKEDGTFEDWLNDTEK
jgi:hypothetical protein